MNVHMTISVDKLEDFERAMRSMLNDGIPGCFDKHFITRVDFCVEGDEEDINVIADVTIITS